MSNYKLAIQIDGNATNIMRLPCVAECYKGTDWQTGEEQLCYHLRGGVYKRLDEYPFRSTVALQGDWLCLDQQGRWHCLTNEQYLNANLKKMNDYEQEKQQQPHPRNQPAHPRRHQPVG